MDERSVFERLDSIEQTLAVEPSHTLKEQQDFLANANKEYLFGADRDEFKHIKSKKVGLSILSQILLLSYGILNCVLGMRLGISIYCSLFLLYYCCRFLSF